MVNNRKTFKGQTFILKRRQEARLGNCKHNENIDVNISVLTKMRISSFVSCWKGKKGLLMILLDLQRRNLKI